jgi:integrase
LLLFLYNTGARVQEVSDLRIAHLTLGRPPSVRLLGKGGKWRACPLWRETAEQLALLVDRRLSEPRRRSIHIGFRTPTHALRDLQACTPTHRRRRDHRRWRSTARFSARVATQGGRPSAGSRCRCQRHPRLARARQPQHDPPLRRDHDAYEVRGHGAMCPTRSEQGCSVER